MSGSTHSCVLTSLENPLLNGLSLGLQNFDAETVGLQSQLFGCCGGGGFAWHESAQGYTRCRLKTRLKRVQSIVDLYRQRWPQHPRNFMQVPASWAAQTLQELAAVIKHDHPPASLQYTPQRQQPSDLWAKAVALNWRFGVEARMLHLGHIDNASLHAFTAEAEGPLALLVEQVDKLWDPLYAEALEFIIQRAYNAEAWLWIDLVYTPQAKDEPAQDLNLRASFSRKIQKLKSAHPLDSLTPDGQSRLRSLLGRNWTLPTGVNRNA